MLQNFHISSYTDALIRLAVETKQIEEYRRDAKMVFDVFQTVPKYLNILVSSQFLIEEKKQFLKLAFKKELDQHFYNLLFLLIDVHLIKKIRSIMQLFLKHTNDIVNVYPGIVISTTPLSATEMQKITKKISLRLNRKVELENQIDSKLIGGLVVKVGDNVFDNSVLSNLNNLKTDLIQAKLNEVEVNKNVKNK